MMQKSWLRVPLAVMLIASSLPVYAADDLEKGFQAPPVSAQPRVWWHWINGNVTLEGIDQDLDWMKRVGIGGVQNFDAAPGGNVNVVAKRVAFLAPEWRAALAHAVQRARTLGMEFTIAGSPGWSETGGPWVKPAQAMKKLVWSETEVAGGTRAPVKLLAPPSATGPFQSIVGGGGLMGASGTLPSLYQDVAVVAYKLSQAELVAMPAPTMTSSSPTDVAALIDGDLNKQVELPYTLEQPSWVVFDYGRPTTIRHLRIVAERTGGFNATGPAGRVEFRRDGGVYEKLIELPLTGAAQQTLSFASITARYFRVVFEPRRAAVPGVPAPTRHLLAELAFDGAARIHRFEDKAGWGVTAALEQQPTPGFDSAESSRSADVIDLSGKMQSDGSLKWTPPPGRWVVLRFGYSLTGRQNHPASPEGTGLEVDKLNREHVMAYASDYLGEYEKSVGAEMMGKNGIGFLLTDSYEAGAQNWTDNLFAEFQRRRGYDLIPWLPVLTGRIVNNTKASEAFLWDFRRTLGDLIAENHYAALSEALHARGMGRYGESHERGRAFIGDGMEVKKTADVPMGAFWVGRSEGEMTAYDADIRESASVAHVYGQNLVAAESFTTNANTFGYSPKLLKPFADRMMADGLNRFVVHTSVHQPIEKPGPGVTLGQFGQWFTRKEIWAEQAGPWLNYLSRSSYLLQQGRFIADIAYFYGEDSNVSAMFGGNPPNIPAGYAHDFINGDALRNEFAVQDGRLVARSGMSYRVLVLDPAARRMTLATLRKLHSLVAEGATVIGDRPVESPSLADDPVEFQRLVNEVFGATNMRGRIVPAGNLATTLTALNIQPDVNDGGVGLRYVHRATADADLYFVSNPHATRTVAEISFRSAGRAAEIWRADDGSITPVSYKTIDGRTIVSLEFAENDSLFVVFRKTGPAEQKIPRLIETTAVAAQGQWRIEFPASAQALEMPVLTSWTSSDISDVRYFAGTATYRTNLQAPRTWFRKGKRLSLDLGDVADLADVSVNGRSVGVTWKAPFELDITEVLRPGQNQIEVKVTNTWTNRMIGDKQPGVAPQAWATFDSFRADSPLRPAGLLGPVHVRVRELKP